MPQQVNPLLVGVAPFGTIPKAKELLFPKELMHIFDKTDDRDYSGSEDSEEEEDLQEVHPNSYQSHSKLIVA